MLQVSENLASDGNGSGIDETYRSIRLRKTGAAGLPACPAARPSWPDAPPEAPVTQ